MSWTPERIELLKTLNDGRSASDIARAMHGISRNAVVGKLRRLRIPLQSSLSAAQMSHNYAMKQRRAKAERAKQSQAALAVATPKKSRPTAAPLFKFEGLPPQSIWQSIPDTKPVSFAELEPHHCRWPVDGGSCGCNKVSGLPYCATHAALAYAPPQRQNRLPHLNIPALGSAAHKNAEEFLKEPA
jgi:GcrA cell cycle regulator